MEKILYKNSDLKQETVDHKLPIHFLFPNHPKGNPSAIIVKGNARFTILTSRLIRLEYSSNKTFEDRPSQAIWFRNQPVPEFTINTDDQKIEIKTQHLHLIYYFHDIGFSKKSLQIKLCHCNTTWTYGDTDLQNLKGTIRTLDQQPGAVNLPDGLISKNGWAILDDTRNLVFDNQCWIQERTYLSKDPLYQDLYFFGYGSDYKACLKDYCGISGKIPLVPKYMLGNWWSRYWAYSQESLQSLMEDFEKNEIPLTICIIDMDWHIVNNPYHKGWTGYTWNKELFPNPQAFIQWLHKKGLHTALNLHPRDGIHPHEDAYNCFAEYMGLDPVSENPIEFDIADPKFTRGYFEFLHHPHEQIGIDFWWMDWQQGNSSKIEGLDPLWWLNHLHYFDMARENKKRPVIFSRWGGWGNHRYPIGFSGDTHVTWSALQFQPYFTSTAANVGYAYWSHDIGGHYQGTEDPELYVRWVQFGVFSPIFRLHSTKSKFSDRRPWAHGPIVFDIVKKYMQLRHAMIPYIYTMVKKCEDESLPFVRPMYFEYPENEQSYCCENQYFFGSELIAAPFTNPCDSNTKLSKTKMWFPAGTWYNFFTGERIEGDRVSFIFGKLDETAVFAKAGAIIPMTPLSGSNSIKNPDILELHVFTGTDGSFTLYEDDGETTNYQDKEFCETVISQNFSEDEINLTIHASQGALHLLPEYREWKIFVYGLSDSLKVQDISGSTGEFSIFYDSNKECCVISTKPLSIKKSVTFSLKTQQPSTRKNSNRILQKCLDLISDTPIETTLKSKLDSQMEAIMNDPSLLQPYYSLIPDSILETLYQMITDSGALFTKSYQGEEYFQCWNNTQNSAAQLNFFSFFSSFNYRGTMPKNLIVKFTRKTIDSRAPELWPNEKWNAIVNYGMSFTKSIKKNLH